MTHSLCGKTFILANKYPGMSGYLAALPEETGMRGNLTKAEAIRVTLHTVEDKPNTYNFQRHAIGGNDWVSFDPSTSDNWLTRSSDKAEAMRIELVDPGLSRNIVKMRLMGTDSYISFTNDGCRLRACYNIYDAVPVLLEDPECETREEEEYILDDRFPLENAIERISLPDVDDDIQTHACQRWLPTLGETLETAGMSGGRLQCKWADQGWGNQKGGIWARLVDNDGKELYSWQAVGERPAPHDLTDVDCEIPSVLFSGEVPSNEEGAEFQARRPTPEGARLELAYEVGGGGGHSLSIEEASLFLFAHTMALQAIVKETEIVIRTLGGDELTVVNKGAEDSEESRASEIRAAVRNILGPRKPFKVIVGGTDQIISWVSPTISSATNGYPQ